MKQGILHSTAILLILNPSLLDCFPFVGVLITKLIFPSSIKSIILFLPSHNFSIMIDSTPFSFKYLAVPEVAYISNPFALNLSAIGTTSALSLSLTVINIAPFLDTLAPLPINAFNTAFSNFN